jgi:hypothetical protein
LLRGFTFSAAGRSDVGKPGEPQVVRTLIEHLAIRGIAADELKPLDEKEKSRWDAGGIDAKLHIRGQEFHVQVTVVPGDSAYWRSACDGLSNRCGNLGDAAQILSEAIDRKKGVASPTTILALDARHAGVVTESQVVAEYFRTQGDPAVRRFAAVVLVGAAAHLCVTIASRIG